MTVDALIQLQLELECIRVNQRGYLQAFPCDNPDTPARLSIFYDGTNYYRYIRYDMPTEMRQLLKLMPVTTLFSAHERVKAILVEDAPCYDLFIGKTYIFPDDAPVLEDAEIIYQEAGHRCAFLVDGEVVSACSSVRENDFAAEAWVETHEAYRRRGYGLRVVHAWASRIRALGKVPFYSHAVSNIASRQLAQSVGMQWVFDVVNYE